jgi:hypothetical protein
MHWQASDGVEGVRGPQTSLGDILDSSWGLEQGNFTMRFRSLKNARAPCPVRPETHLKEITRDGGKDLCMCECVCVCECVSVCMCECV